MALPFYQLLGLENTLPDGGIVDPASGLSFAGMPENTTTEVTPQPTRTITGADTFRDAAGNLIQRITYSDGSFEDRLIDTGGGANNQNNTPAQNVVVPETNERRQSAFEVMKERFTAMGLGSLAAELEKIFKGEAKTRIGNTPIPIPTSESGFYLALIETEEYYKRFGKTNELRIKSGYSALDERTILAMEDQYQKTMKSYGMPTGFYDTPEDFQTFLANDLSELELADRLQASRQFAMGVNPAIKDQLKNLYNIDDNMLSAYIADPAKGQQVLNNLAGRSLTGAAALLSGLTAEAAKVAEGFGAGEMRFQEQQQRFGAAATLAQRGEMLSQISRGEQAFGEQQAVEVAFGGLESSVKQAERLASRERARFGGAAGTTTSSFTRPTAGQI